MKLRLKRLGSYPGFFSLPGQGLPFGQSFGRGFFQGGQGLFLGQPGGRCLGFHFGFNLSLVLGRPGRDSGLPS